MPLLVPTIDQLNTHIPQCTVKNESVSRWSVGMHVQHCLLATNGICRALIDSEPYPGKIKKSLLRRVVFLTGLIPRGRGKSPEAAQPHEHTTELELRELLAKAQASVREAAESNSDGWWQHFAFGVMKRDQALKFIEIHNKHHLKIISDILSH